MVQSPSAGFSQAEGQTTSPEAAHSNAYVSHMGFEVQKTVITMTSLRVKMDGNPHGPEASWPVCEMPTP